jgi:murein L,D-transpeptidase YafK
MTCAPSLPVKSCSILPNSLINLLSSAALRFCLWQAILLVFFCLSSLVPACAQAPEWQPLLSPASLPSHLVAVDKARQQFLFYTKQDAFSLKYRYSCSTGQVAGDKEKRNDLRTPEGIYFIKSKIADGLDFKEYGGIAYTLNYPNPVDRLRGKSGHGIWIHSKGCGIKAFSTRGCVAIALRDIDEVGPELVPGTAVLLAPGLDEAGLFAASDNIARQLRQLMQEWSEAWSARSAKMFQYYDAAAYGRAMPQSFAAFRAQKEKLFRTLDFIKIYNRQIHVLEGPGYWVSWTEQLYTASNMSSEGIRRLYWQKDDNDTFRIVGMEWIPCDLGLKTALRQGRLAAAGTSPAEAAPESPVMPEGSAAPAGQEEYAGRERHMPEMHNPLPAHHLRPSSESSGE